LWYIVTVKNKKVVVERRDINRVWETEWVIDPPRHNRDVDLRTKLFQDFTGDSLPLQNNDAVRGKVAG
jgi:hypothetical protein